jgi:hypothetical protein
VRWKRDIRAFYRAVKNHGVPEELIDKQFTAADDFFALPEEVKDLLPFDGSLWSGYQHYKFQTSNTEIQKMPDTNQAMLLASNGRSLSGPARGTVMLGYIGLVHITSVASVLRDVVLHVWCWMLMSERHAHQNTLVRPATQNCAYSTTPEASGWWGNPSHALRLLCTTAAAQSTAHHATPVMCIHTLHTQLALLGTSAHGQLSPTRAHQSPALH